MRHGIRQRLAWDVVAPYPPAQAVWMHGASAGDILALAPTLRALLQHEPRLSPLLSTLTNSGYALAQQEMPEVPLIYAPYDLPHTTLRALQAIRPQVLVLEYTELWPALIHAAKRVGTKLVLHNGRFGEGSLMRYRMLFSMVGPLLAEFDVLLMRDEMEAERAISLGAQAERVKITGNTKFDSLKRQRPQSPQEARTLWRERLGFHADDWVWIWGSTHASEEAQLRPIYEALRAQYPQLKLIIAPRYTDRAAGLAALFQGTLLSEIEKRRGEKPQVIVVDRVGELSQIYACAELAFVGGSFTKRGGQNILEPALHAIPVTFGPHTANISDQTRVLLGRGGLQVRTLQELSQITQQLITRPTERRKLGTMAHEATLAIHGAAERNAQEILKLLS